MNLTFDDWEPFSPERIERLKEGDEIYVFDPSKEPQIFQAFFVKFHKNRKQQIAGVVVRVSKPVFAGFPLSIPGITEKEQILALINRVGFHKLFQEDHMINMPEYDS